MNFTIKALSIAGILLLAATGSLVAGERGGHSGGHWGGGGGFSGQRHAPGGGYGWHRNYGAHWGRGGGFGVDILGGIAGGIIGGTLGSIFAPDPEPPVIVVQPPELERWSPEWLSYCKGKYPNSFDAHTGYFVGNDGQKYFCH